MALAIQTFSNQTGGDAFFKAIGHPLAVEPAAALLARLRRGGPVAVYDFGGGAAAFAALNDLAGVEIAAVFVQDLTKIGTRVLDRAAQPVTELKASGARTVLVPAFDAG